MWFVYAQVRTVMSQAWKKHVKCIYGKCYEKPSGPDNEESLTLSHGKPSTSINILISSGMAKDGWVSFSCMATLSGNVSKEVLTASRHPNLDALNRRTISLKTFWKPTYTPQNFKKFQQDIVPSIYLQSCRTHKIFLFQTQFFSLEKIIIRIQNPRDVFC